jgi:hypothetical protein
MNNLERLSIEEIVALIEGWKILHQQLIGNLYPNILADQIGVAIEYLETKRNYNYFTGESYEKEKT